MPIRSPIIPSGRIVCYLHFEQEKDFSIECILSTTLLSKLLKFSRRSMYDKNKYSRNNKSLPFSHLSKCLITPAGPKPKETSLLSPRNLVPRVLRLFASVGRQERRWEIRNSNFLIGCLVTACRNPAVMKFQYPRVSPSDQPLAKEPEDTGNEIGPRLKV